MSYEVVTDLRHTMMTDTPDINRPRQKIINLEDR
jgi:hypothetical protein